MGSAMWCAKLFLMLPFSLAKSKLLRASLSTCYRVARVNNGIGAASLRSLPYQKRDGLI